MTPRARWALALLLVCLAVVAATYAAAHYAGTCGAPRPGCGVGYR